MSLPETIWWCKTHGQRGRYSDKCIMVSYLEVQGASVADPCHMVEVGLHPVGSRVAGPGDLVIRRGDIDYEQTCDLFLDASG